MVEEVNVVDHLHQKRRSPRMQVNHDQVMQNADAVMFSLLIEVEKEVIMNHLCECCWFLNDFYVLHQDQDCEMIQTRLFVFVITVIKIFTYLLIKAEVWLDRVNLLLTATFNTLIQTHLHMFVAVYILPVGFIFLLTTSFNVNNYHYLLLRIFPGDKLLDELRDFFLYFRLLPLQDTHMLIIFFKLQIN